MMTENVGKRFSFIHVDKVRTAKDVRDLECHNSRLIRVANADSKLSHNNVDFRPRGGSKRARSLWERIRDRLASEKIVPRKNGVIGAEILMTFSPEMTLHIGWKAWANDSMNWAEQRWGAENILHATLHRDETTPHLHLFLLPIVERSKARKWKFQKAVSYKKVFGGNGDIAVQRLSQLQSDYADEVGKKHGLERGVKGSKRKHIPVKKLRALSDEVSAEEKKAQEELRASVSATMVEFEAATSFSDPDYWREKIRLALENVRRVGEDQLRKFSDAAKRSWRADQYERERKIFSGKIESLSVENTSLHEAAAKYSAEARAIPLLPVLEKLTSATLEWPSAESLKPICALPSGDVLEIDLDSNWFRSISGSPRGQGTMASRRGGRNAIDLVIYITGWSFDEAVMWLHDCTREGTVAATAQKWCDDQQKSQERDERRDHRISERARNSQCHEDKWPKLLHDFEEQQISKMLVEKLREGGLLWANVHGEPVFASDSDESKVIVRSLSGPLWLESNTGEIFDIVSRTALETIVTEDPLEALRIATQLDKLRPWKPRVLAIGRNRDSKLKDSLRELARKSKIMVRDNRTNFRLIRWLNEIKCGFTLLKNLGPVVGKSKDSREMELGGS